MSLPEYPFACRLCGAMDETLRRLDAPLSITYRGVSRRLPAGSFACYRHLKDFRKIPGRYVSRRDVAAR